ncbi:MAG: lasso peptide biosynthesis B2 protein [Acidobacteriia bacterium]|nr:lasso peptide biosynthesis B2 protein [Terriglobia bacterium]
MTTWSRFWRLSGRARGVALEAAAALTATYMGLRLGGFRRWKAALAWFVPAAAGPAIPLNRAKIDSAREIARLEQAVARHLFFRANCLESSLVLWWLLERRGIAAELRIGVRKDAGNFEAHAWVESGGAVLNDPGEAHRHFVPFEGSIASMETQTH